MFGHFTTLCMKVLMKKETVRKPEKNQENEAQNPNLFEATQFAWIMEFMKLIRCTADTTFSIFKET